ncbi:hypothetical protein B0J14DRAFT_82165 [Halenospora varia]|nr:hypothetical protein B0J14DRAFT_82165 [Halenospora varia]
MSSPTSNSQPFNFDFDTSVIQEGTTPLATDTKLQREVPKDTACHLLRLPVELRLMVWKLCLTSPTRRIEPIERRAAHYRKILGSNSPSGPLFYLTYKEDQKTEFITLSLLRTCRQIYRDTYSLFWNNHTIVFDSPTQILQYNNKMGRFVSRCFTSIHLPFSIEGSCLKDFEKVIDILTTRSKSLRHITLAVDKREFLRVMQIGHYNQLLADERRSISPILVDLERILAKLSNRGLDASLLIRGSAGDSVWTSYYAYDDKMLAVGRALGVAMDGKCTVETDMGSEMISEVVWEDSMPLRANFMELAEM